MATVIKGLELPKGAKLLFARSEKQGEGEKGENVDPPSTHRFQQNQSVPASRLCPLSHFRPTTHKVDKDHLSE